jgi:DNA-binding MarR family transcriptional regulator
MAETSQPSRKQRAITDVVLAIFRANGALVAMGDALVAPLGLTSARWQVLGAIGLAGRALTVPEIARAMGLTRQAVQKQIDLLLDEGCVRLEPNARNARSPLVAQTAAGTTAARRAEALWNRRTAELASRATAADLEATQRVLDALAGAFAKEQ